MSCALGAGLVRALGDVGVCFVSTYGGLLYDTFSVVWSTFGSPWRGYKERITFLAPLLRDTKAQVYV
jgi:hypothetical protein